MTDAVTICNRALSKLGTQKTISSLTEPSVAATQCSLWYDQCRQALLRTAPWGFARQQLVLTQMGDAIPDGTAPYPYLFMYAYPADCMKLRYVLPVPPVSTNPAPPAGTTVPNWWLRPSRSCRFIVGNNHTTSGDQRVILTNVQNAIGVYTYDATDPNTFDPLFALALTDALAAYLVMPLTGNAGLADKYMQSCDKTILQARAADGNEAIPKTDHVPDWIQTREIGGWFGFNFAGNPDGFGSWGTWQCGWDDMSWGM